MTERMGIRRGIGWMAIAMCLPFLGATSVAIAQVASVELEDINTLETVTSVELAIGDSLFLGVLAKDARGDEIDFEDLVFRWTSSNPGVVEIAPSDDIEAYLYARGNGVAKVEILVNSFSYLIDVSVTSPLPLVVALPDSVLPPATRTNALDNTILVRATRMRSVSCLSGYVTDRQGLLVTSYSAIRGAEVLELSTSGGRRSTSALVAAYDVQRDVAILRADGFGTFFSTDTSAEPADNYWISGYTGCQTSPTTLKTSLEALGGSLAAMRADSTVAVGMFGAPVISRDGAVIGIVADSANIIPATVIEELLDRAEASEDALAVADVARNERHRFGSIELSSGSQGDSARVEPMQSNQWAQLGRTARLPFVFSGPEGNYRVQLLVDGAVASQVVVRIQFGLESSRTLMRIPGAPIAQQTPDQGQGRAQPPPEQPEAEGGGGFPMPILIVGAIGAGAAAFLLGGSKTTDPVCTPPDPLCTDPTGTVTVYVERP